MKKLLILLTTALLAACSSDSPTLFKPASVGLPYEVLVICEKDFWEAPAGNRSPVSPAVPGGGRLHPEIVGTGKSELRQSR